MSAVVTNAVEVVGLFKSYGGRRILDLEELAIPRGEFFVLLGPSGSGKTTFLRSLAGLISPDGGRVLLEGKSTEGVAPHERDLGVVFQGLALWPHLSVRGNLALGLARRVPDADERRARIEETARELGIDRHLSSKPARLSGGERQRVALARALVRRPALLLLDEPFSDLDARLRREAARLVRRMHDAHGMTSILITHDRTDAHLLADRIGVMREGRLVACDAPDRLHHAPPGAFTAQFLSDAALLRGKVESGHVHTALGALPLDGDARGSILIAVRPDEVQIAATGSSSAPREGTPGRVIACEFAGGPWRCRVALGSEEIAAYCETALAPGAEVRITPPRTPRTPLLEDA